MNTNKPVHVVLGHNIDEIWGEKDAPDTPRDIQGMTDLYCATCGEKLTDDDEIAEETESPRIPGEIVCDKCWFDEYCDRCVLCDDYMRKKDTEYVLIVEEFQGTLPGCYKFKRPWYADGMIEMHIWNDALTKVRDLHPREYDNDSVSGYVCKECALRGCLDDRRT